MPRVTLKDVAKQSGFSVTTVSRALGGHDDVNEQTRQHVIEVANDLGYEPNLIARQLQSHRTGTIGIISPAREPNSDDDFFSLLISARLWCYLNPIDTKSINRI